LCVTIASFRPAFEIIPDRLAGAQLLLAMREDDSAKVWLVCSLWLARCGAAMVELVQQLGDVFTVRVGAGEGEQVQESSLAFHAMVIGSPIRLGSSVSSEDPDGLGSGSRFSSDRVQRLRVSPDGSLSRGGLWRPTIMHDDHRCED
jgi:hypothetical protein